MLSLVERVNLAIRGDDLLPPGARVLVAVSGGADSTALAHLLAELAPSAGFVVAALAHFNHRLRAAGADDQAFCGSLADTLGVPLEVGHADVADQARRMRTSIEDAGRRLRYAFLREAAQRLGASRVAAGHTLDDQAETVLLALIRGAGPRGLAGMRARRGNIVRPLLAESHETLVRWLAERGLAHREDESNSDPRYLRNRVRLELLPLLRSRFSPAIASVLARTSAIAADDADLLDQLAAEAEAAVVREGHTGRVELSLDELLALPPAVARRVALIALQRAAGRGPEEGRRPSLGFEHAIRLLQLGRGRLNGPVALPGLEAERVGKRLALAPKRGRNRPEEAEKDGGLNFFRSALSISREASLPGGRVLSAQLRPVPAGGVLQAIDRDPLTATVDAAALNGGLSVRFRRPGDRFRPLGLGGRKSLQDFFVDRKVPRRERDGIPLVVDGDDRIVWVAGHAVSEDFRVNERTRDVVILKLRGESV